METITIAVAMTVGLTEVVKRTNILSERYTPLVSLFIGVAVTLLLTSLDLSTIPLGIIAGLSASGLWSGVKHTIK